jgi:metallo-beta-lactamase class B
MIRALSALIASVVVAGATSASLMSQSPPVPPQKPDSPEVRRLIDAAVRTAGTEWAEAADYFCAADQTRVNRADDPELEPTRVFDNLAVIGRTGTAVWVVTTSEGLVLIDAGYADQIDSVLLAGMKKLDLDPARVTYVLLGHGHADHFGGASYFQQRGARVAMAGPDWDLIEAQGQRAGAPPQGAAAAAPPKRDIVILDGRPIVIGDVTFTPVAIPGHTPGSMGFIFPVTDRGTAYVAGIFGGTVLLPARLAPDALQRYIAVIQHWADVTKRMNVEVEIQNHPLYDGLTDKLQRLKQRGAGQPNPFVVGTDSYQRFVRVMSECMGVQAARRLP